MGDLIDREKALGCFWAYEDGDETEMSAYDRLQALPIVAEVEDCISRQAAITALMEDAPEVWTDSDYELGMRNQHKYDVNVIKALPSAQPTQNNTSNTLKSLDCISRQDAIDGADEIIKRDTSGNNAVVEAMKAWKVYIGNLPSAQPEMKKGKWYKPTGMMPPEYAGVYRCSECDEIAMRDWKHHKQILTNFCPNCGADMRGEENEEP